METRHPIQIRRLYRQPTSLIINVEKQSSTASSLVKAPYKKRNAFWSQSSWGHFTEIGSQKIGTGNCLTPGFPVFILPSIAAERESNEKKSSVPFPPGFFPTTEEAESVLSLTQWCIGVLACGYTAPSIPTTYV